MPIMAIYREDNFIKPTYYVQIDIQYSWFTNVKFNCLESDLDKFDVMYGKTVDNIPDVVFNYSSAEICAQYCIYQGCFMFSYNHTTFTCDVYLTDPTATYHDIADANAYIFVRRLGEYCYVIKMGRVLFCDHWFDDHMSSLSQGSNIEFSNYKK